LSLCIASDFSTKDIDLEQPLNQDFMSAKYYENDDEATRKTMVFKELTLLF